MKFHFERSLPYLLVAAAAILWGGIGIFIEALDRMGFSSMQIVALRVGSATVMLFAYLLIRNRSLLRIDLSDAYYFFGTGVLSIAFFNWCYFTAIKELSLSVAVILLYSGPAFVVIMSRIFFGEPMTKTKILALLLTMAGCALVVELIPIQVQSISWYGILVGLGSGFGYALYSMFGKMAQKKYATLTILFYTFLTASIVMLPLSGILAPQNIALIDRTAFLWTLGLGLLPTVLAYLLYTEGLSRIEAGKASITALLEPVAATILGVLVFKEVLSIGQIAGIVLVIVAVVMIQLREAVGRLYRKYQY